MLNVDFILLLAACVVALLGSGIVCLFVPSLRGYFWFFIIIFSLTSVETSFAYIAKGSGKTKVFAIKGILYTLVFATSNILMLTVFHLGLDGYFLSFIIAYFVTCVYLLFASNIYKTKFSLKINKPLFVQMMKYSIPFIPSAISWWINSSSDKYMLLWMVGSDANGLYGAAQKIPTIITAVTSIFTQAWQLSAMENYNDDDFSIFFSRMFRLINMLLLLGACVVLVCNKFLATFFFKNDFFIAWKYVPMLTVAAVFSTMAGFLASAFTSAKKTSVLFVSTCIGAVVNILGNLVLIHFLGLLGATIATAFSFFVMVVIRLFTIRKIVKLSANMPKLYVSLALLFIAAILVAYVDNYYPIAIITVTLVIALNLKEMVQAVVSTYKKILSK